LKLFQAAERLQATVGDAPEDVKSEVKKRLSILSVFLLSAQVEVTQGSQAAEAINKTHYLLRHIIVHLSPCTCRCQGASERSVHSSAPRLGPSVLCTSGHFAVSDAPVHGLSPDTIEAQDAAVIPAHGDALGQRLFTHSSEAQGAAGPSLSGYS
jgi:hypothetical protein